MKTTIICTICTLLLCVSLSGQDYDFRAVDALLKSSKISYDHGDFDLAIDQSSKAYDLAAPNQDNLRMAKALQRQAMGLIAKPKKVKASRKKAEEKLQSSLNLLKDDQYRITRINSLVLLKKLAGLNKDAATEDRYQLQIDEINALVQASKNEKKLKAEANKLEAKAEELEVTKNTLSAQKNSLTEKVINLADEKLKLDNRVRRLSQAQLKSELKIALQKNLVDSLAFQSELDHLLLAQNKMQLVEQASKMELQKTTLQLKENELELTNSKRNTLMALIALLALSAGGLFLRFRGMRKHNQELQLKNEIIEVEREKSEKLLLNILPQVVADELKVNGSAKARRYDTATVLFTDFVNFTGISKNLSAESIVTLLDDYFKAFDEIITRHQLEKIKTIGDAYMCVGGLPNAKIGNPIDVINAALEIQELINQKKIAAEKKGTPYFEARIGIHSGPLVAGVVGSKKFAFDIWGDTVNIASRLETGGQPGKVNISGATFALIKDQFNCESRGTIPIKNIGEIDMYFVKGGSKKSA